MWRISPWGGVCGEVYHTAASGASATRGVAFLHTTWHHVRGEDFALRLKRAAHAAWGRTPPGGSVGLPAVATHWRRAGRDAGASRYEDTGFSPLAL